MNASAWEKWRVEQHTSSPLTRFHSFPYCLTERYRLYEKLLYHFWCKSTFPIDSKSTVFINLLSSTLKFSPKMKRWLTDLWNHTLMGVFFSVWSFKDWIRAAELSLIIIISKSLCCGWKKVNLFVNVRTSTNVTDPTLKTSVIYFGKTIKFWSIETDSRLRCMINMMILFGIFHTWNGITKSYSWPCMNGVNGTFHIKRPNPEHDFKHWCQNSRL